MSSGKAYDGIGNFADVRGLAGVVRLEVAEVCRVHPARQIGQTRILRESTYGIRFGNDPKGDLDGFSIGIRRSRLK
jgi:hypothetical protein